MRAAPSLVSIAERLAIPGFPDLDAEDRVRLDGSIGPPALPDIERFRRRVVGEHPEHTLDRTPVTHCPLGGGEEMNANSPALGFRADVDRVQLGYVRFLIDWVPRGADAAETGDLALQLGHVGGDRGVRIAKQALPEAEPVGKGKPRERRVGKEPLVRRLPGSDVNLGDGLRIVRCGRSDPEIGAARVASPLARAREVVPREPSQDQRMVNLVVLHVRYASTSGEARDDETFRHVGFGSFHSVQSSRTP